MINDSVRTCPESGVELHRDVRPAEICYKGLAETVMLPGWYPPHDCEVEGADSIHTGSDMRVSDEALNRLKVQDQQKAHAISNMTEEERMELSEKIEAELKALDKDIGASRVQDIDPNLMEVMKTLAAVIEVYLDAPIEGDVVITQGSDNVFADLGLEKAEELKATADRMIEEGKSEAEIAEALKAIDSKSIIGQHDGIMDDALLDLLAEETWNGDPRDMGREDIEILVSTTQNLRFRSSRPFQFRAPGGKRKMTTNDATRLKHENDRLLQRVDETMAGTVRLARDMFCLGIMRQGSYYMIRRLALSDLRKKKRR